MSSTQTPEGELRQIITGYCNRPDYPDIERLKNLLNKVSGDQSYKLLSSIRDYDNNTMLTLAARQRRNTEVCVTLLSSLTPAGRLKLILVNKFTALHQASYEGHTDTVSGILNCLTAEQQLQLVFTQDSDGNTALHDAAQGGSTETVKILLDNLTPEQQLQLLSVKNRKDETAYQKAAGIYKHLASNIMTTLEHYQKEADYRVNYRE